MGATAYEELSVTTFQAFCARLLREEALEAGIDPFAAPVTAADRLAMLLERIDELPLALARPARQPERGARLDRAADRPAQGRADHRRRLRGVGREAARGGRAGRRGPRASASSPRSTPRTTGCWRTAGTLDAGDLVLHAFRLLRTKPHVRAAARRALPARARRRVPGHRTSRRTCCCACSSPSTRTSPSRPTTTRRSTASAARRRRTSPTSAPSGRRRRSCG